MQNTIFKYSSMNDIQNLIIREKLEDSITLKEFKTNNGYSTVKYSLYHNELLVSSFTDEVDDSGAIREAYQYFLGFIDAVITLRK